MPSLKFFDSTETSILRCVTILRFYEHCMIKNNKGEQQFTLQSAMSMQVIRVLATKEIKIFHQTYQYYLYNHSTKLLSVFA
jgi:hypothetical protein